MYTFKISAGRLAYILHKYGDVLEDKSNKIEDKSSKIVKTSNKMKDALGTIREKQRSIVINHIKSFSPVETQYTVAQNPRKRCLSSRLTLKKMYELYLIKCKENNISPVVSESKYATIFTEIPNLYFNELDAYTCPECESMYMKLKEGSFDDERQKKPLQVKLTLHLIDNQLSTQELEKDMMLASRNPYKYFAFSFGLQRPLPFPIAFEPASYYAQSFYVLNEGFHNFYKNKVDMYAWDQSMASTGAEEVASCCMKYLENIKNQTHVIAYSDNSDKNRNAKISLMWRQVIRSPNNNIRKITHKFVSQCFTDLPINKDFDIIEEKAEEAPYIYAPQHYYDLIRDCGKDDKFILHEMKLKDFLAGKNLGDAIIKEADNPQDEMLDWSQISAIKFTRNDPYMSYQTKASTRASPYMNQLFC